MTNIEILKDILKEKGYKLTPQRRFIIKAILEHANHHLKIDDIYSAVKKACPEIGIATVYRTVQLFEEVGILSKQYFDDGCYRYELANKGETHNHHHLICSNCGKIIEIEDKYFEEIEQHIEKNKGFRIVNHTVVFYGLCNECSRN